MQYRKCLIAAFLSAFSIQANGQMMQSFKLQPRSIKKLIPIIKKGLAPIYQKVHLEQLHKHSILGRNNQGHILWKKIGMPSGPVESIAIGSVGNILKASGHSKHWSLSKLADEIGVKADDVSFLGAGAAYREELGFSAELIIEGKFPNQWNNKIGYLTGGQNRGRPAVIDAKTDMVGPYGHVSFFRNQDAQALWIQAESRISGGALLSFTEVIKDILAKEYPQDMVGLAGYIRVSQASQRVSSKKLPKIKLHVMPDFLNYDIKASDINQWLDLFHIEVSDQNPFHMMNFIINHDHSLPLRVTKEHAHGYRQQLDIAGHYEGDIANGHNIKYDAILLPIKMLHLKR